MRARIIAFFLPQFYPTPTNNHWYGNGFTEWTNVGKAKPLFRGHYQPKIPADLGYYDLRYPEIRKMQAEMAKEAGIEGFCYYHYWFSKGRTELDFPLKEVIRLQQPDYPFCLCWANQSWYSKFWNNDILSIPKLITEQKYNEEDDLYHFRDLIDTFRDKRYIKVEGKLLFMIYRPLEFNNVNTFITKWQKYALDYGLPGFYFVGQAINDDQAKKILELGFNGVNIVRKDDYLNNWKYNNIIRRIHDKIIRGLGGAPYHYKYKDISKFFIKEDGIERENNIFPTIIPNWDHTPRSGKSGVVFHQSTPDYFRIHVEKALKTISPKKDEYKIIFLKSWNEWGEGNYMEPDLKFGLGYIDALKKSLQEIVLQDK